MQSLTNTLPANMAKDAEETKASHWQLFLTTGALILCGSFTYSIYPPPVNAAALGLMVGVFYYSLHKNDPVSFFIQLFIGNFFVFGNKLGGNYNLAAFAAIVFYSAIHGRIKFLRFSVFDNSIKTALFLWCIFDLLSVTGGNYFPIGIEIQNFFAFCILLFSFYFISRIGFTENDIYKFVIAISLFFGYEFLVALNQKYELINSPFPFFPKTDNSIEFELDIVRSVSTLNNFEAFAEWCVSLIALLIPGILSGSFLKKSRFFYYFSIATVLAAAISMVYSGTRSSMLLLPVALVVACLALGRRLNSKIIVYLVIGGIGIFFLNTAYKFIDLSVFSERSEETVDFNHMTLQSVLNGDQMNRGGLFPYAMKQVEKTNLIGRGYFVSPDEYRTAHFKKGDMDDGIADYHNLYMSSYVMWGPIGFLSMMFLFVYSIIRGWKLYWTLRKKNHFMIDLLLGCNLLFTLLMINQFKIQLIRDINYFTLIMLMLSFYISLTWQLRQTALVEETEPVKPSFS